MTEHDASPRQNLRPRSYDHRSNSQDGQVAPGSPETVESNTSGSLMNSTWTTDATLAQRLSHDGSSANGHANEHSNEHGHGDIARENKRRSHKPRHSGAFLLSDPFEEAVADESRGRNHRSSRTPDRAKGAAARHNNTRQMHDGGVSGLGLSLSPEPATMRNSSADRPPGTPPRRLVDNMRQEQLQASPRFSPPRSSTSSVDMDSTHIVSMALNLSESRRLAQRRHVSQPMPPRLVPLPTDNAVAGSLRHQLQQQRRVSRTLSPRPDRGAPQRLGTSGRTASPLQPTFDPMHADGSYKYHFSNSTLARAQRAKDYMELLAQYRRVLELIPPLQPNGLSKASSSSDPTPSADSLMPMYLNSTNMTCQIGRPYDPLQYIRNRKVRARERMNIDGESQGFGDVNRVTDWVDDVAKWVATRQMRTPGSSALPPFNAADVYSIDASSAPTARPSISLIKPKRPRNDWIIEPADLLADVYWLEQDDHKKLVEDANGRRVFPQDSELYQTLSRTTNDTSPGVAKPPGYLLGSGSEDAPGKVARPENDHAAGSTRERARHKLHELRSFHRRAGSVQGQSHGILRRRDSSSSSSSDSDNQKKRGRSDTFGGTEKDILEKQMAEMIAREAQETDTKSLQEPENKQLKTRPSQIVITPDSPATSNPTEPIPHHNQIESRADLSDANTKDHISRWRTESPPHHNRESLDVPVLRARSSIESEYSSINSPALRHSLSDNHLVGSGADVSPSPSRAGSPSRNPFSKIKQKFRDRSRERALERHLDALPSEKEDMAEAVMGGAVLKAAKTVSNTPELADDRRRSRSRPTSVGLEPKLSQRITGESLKSQRKMNSVRSGDSNSGLRGFFKGPRFDSVLKSGVSRVSEMLWKKEEPEAEDSDPSSSSSDDSDSEIRGRREERKSLSPTSSNKERPSYIKHESKHFLDVMPPFISTSESRDDTTHHEAMGYPLSKTTSTRSARLELLKPPRIDVSVADASTGTQKDQTMDISDTESHTGSVDEQQGSIGGQTSVTPPVDAPVTHPLPAEWSRDNRYLGIPEQCLSPKRVPLSKREIARLRAMMLSSGVLAMEISRRAHQAQTIGPNTPNDDHNVLSALGNSVTWPEVTQLAPEEQRRELVTQPISQADLFLVTARVLGAAIQKSHQHWESEAEAFNRKARADIDGHIERLRTRVQLDLSAMTRAAGEVADEVSGDLVDGQRRKVKSVVDVIEKLSRRRRRRFRWVRRGGWLALEWLLVGIMWYVWFVVMIAKLFLGVGKGLVQGARWLLWL